MHSIASAEGGRAMETSDLKPLLRIAVAEAYPEYLDVFDIEADAFIAESIAGKASPATKTNAGKSRFGIDPTSFPAREVTGYVGLVTSLIVLMRELIGLIKSSKSLIPCGQPTSPQGARHNAKKSESFAASGGESDPNKIDEFEQIKNRLMIQIRVHIDSEERSEVIAQCISDELMHRVHVK